MKHNLSGFLHWKIGLCFGILIWGLSSCQQSGLVEPETTKPDSQSAQPKEALSGGSGTVYATSRKAFSLPVSVLSREQQTQFFVGNSFFNRNWVAAPASTTARDGLGPLFNARSCSACHFLDGRGRPPLEQGEPLVSMLLRLSIPGKGPNNSIVPEPHYGGQLNGRGILGVPGEGKVVITYEEIPGTFNDGTTYQLRKPTYTITDLPYGALHPETRISPRTAPFMIGMGLLEAIPEATLLALADPKDQNGDGISGRPNYVWDEARGTQAIGRFGWKSNQPNIAQQTSGAFLGDIGITSNLFPNENCTSVQAECRQAKTGGQPEIEPRILKQVIFYARTLGVPARRNWQDAEVRRGEQLFQQARCSSCHIPELKTGTVEDIPKLSNQTIRPYTDLLLHDMGEGLADHRRDFEANGTEWRTAPLWGIGLVEKVNGHTFFLHDGRARNLTEAILWHGGEAEASKENFRMMKQTDRQALIRFLESL